LFYDELLLNLSYIVVINFVDRIISGDPFFLATEGRDHVRTLWAVRIKGQLALPDQVVYRFIRLDHLAGLATGHRLLKLGL
jgi:hypothetical protein